MSLLNDTPLCDMEKIIEKAKSTCSVDELADFASKMLNIISNVDELFDPIEECLDLSLYQEWEGIHSQLIEQVESFSEYVANDYGGCLDAIAMDVRDNLDDTGSSDFFEKVNNAAQVVFEEQEERKAEVLESILNVFSK